jgi:glucuronoarabinoxylan endo-1,4-beta-xylanase
MLLAMALALGVAAFVTGMPKGQTATINWTEVHQQIDGFGASSANNPVLRAVTDDQADLFFDTTKGAGLSLLRTQIHPDGSSTEIVTAQKAVARGALVWGSPWSPTAKFKTNGNVNYGGHLLRSEYAAWAHTLAAYVQMMRANGVPMYAISVQNEPDISIDYESCLYTPQEMHDFVPYLHSALHEAGVGNTKIMIAEDAEWKIDLAKATIADSNVAKDVGVVAAHGYLAKIQPYKTGSAHLWETEVYDREISKYDGSISEGLRWASTVHKFLTVAEVSAWHYWGLRTDDDDNGGLTDLNGNPAKRLYVLGQWSKFVRPGWYRIGVSYSAKLQITAFKDPAGKSFAIVAVNSGSTAIAEKFTLDGFSTSSVTPWITSDSLSLSAQDPVSVRGATFNYTLPALSVTTFYGAVSKTN